MKQSYTFNSLSRLLVTKKFETENHHTKKTELYLEIRIFHKKFIHGTLLNVCTLEEYTSNHLCRFSIQIEGENAVMLRLW